MDSAEESIFVEDIVNRHCRYINCRADRDMCRQIDEDGGFDWSSPFSGYSEGIALQNGDDGSIFDTAATTDFAKNLLIQAYRGELPKIWNVVSGVDAVLDEVHDTENYYFLGIAGDSYSLWKRESGNVSALISWTASTLINDSTGDPNEISIKTSGTEFDVYINCYHVASYSDSEFSSGYAGVLVSEEPVEQSERSDVRVARDRDDRSGFPEVGITVHQFSCLDEVGGRNRYAHEIEPRALDLEHPTRQVPPGHSRHDITTAPAVCV